MNARVRSEVDHGASLRGSSAVSALDGLTRVITCGAECRHDLVCVHLVVLKLQGPVERIEALAYAQEHSMPVVPPPAPQSFRVRLLQALSLHSALYRRCFLLARRARAATIGRL